MTGPSHSGDEVPPATHQAPPNAEQSMRRLAAIVASSTDAIIGKTLDGIITDWNAGAEAIYGYQAEEIIGRPITTLVPPDGMMEFQEFMVHLRRGEKVEHHETWRVTKHGRRIPVWLSISPIRDGAGRIVGASSIGRDMSDKKGAEEALRASEQRVRMLLDSTAEAIYGVDREGQCTFCNLAGVRLIGYDSCAELLGKSMHDMIHHSRPDGTALPAEDCPIIHALRAGQNYHGEPLVFWRKNGTCFPAECWSHPLIENGTVMGAVVTFLDITERKRAEEALLRFNADLEDRVRRRTAELEAANKELEAFSYSVSHDLRAPLRHIAGFSKILLEEFEPSLPDPAKHLLERIEDGTRRMGMLVDDLLNLARVGRRDLTLQVTGLQALVEEVIADLKPDLGDRQVEWRIGNLPYVDCDAGLMKQVFQNLLANAVKFSRPRNRAIIEIGHEVHDNTSTVFVRDNGVGFSMKYSGKLFGVFQRLHRLEDFDGTGVGLAIVQRIVQKHGGRIWAQAELDKGATFYFNLGKYERAEVTAEITKKTAAAGEKS